MDTDKTSVGHHTPPPLRILLVEDNEHDVLAFRRAFQKSEVDCEITHYLQAEIALERLQDDVLLFDLMVTDYHLPGMSGLDLCLELLNNQSPLPLVILTGAGTERLAAEALKAGVNDYLVKDSGQGYLELLPIVLPAVVQRYNDRLARRKAEEERKKLIIELQEALAQVKRLSGLLPICANCKNIRDDKGYWQDVAVYVRDHSEADFTHGICPDCAKKLYPELYKKSDERRQEIMDALKKLGRANLSEIAAAVNLPQSNTLNRLKMMLENGQVKHIEMDGQNFYEL